MTAEHRDMSSRVGYLGLSVAVLISFILGALSLYQGARYFQGQSTEWLISSLIDQSSSRSYSTFKKTLAQINEETSGAIEVKWLMVEGPRLSPLYLTRVQEMSPVRPLEGIEGKPWYDAFWTSDRTWRDGEGGRWAQAPHMQGRIVVYAPPESPPDLRWRALCWGWILALLIALLIARYFEGRPWTGWAQLTVSGALISSALVGEISHMEREVVEAGRQLIEANVMLTPPHLELAQLIPLSALMPLLILACLTLFTRGRKSNHRVAYAYMAPTVISVGLLVFVPFSIGILLAFTRHDHGEFHWVGLEHFGQILFSGEYALSHPLNFYFTLAVTLLWTALNVVLHTGLGLSLALLLNREGLRFRGIYRALLIIPWAIPNYITALIWKGMFNQQYGLINHCLQSLGIEPVAWMGSFWGSMTANVATNTWLGFPFMMVVSLGALQSIPKDLYEAATIAGASRWVQFKEITSPLLMPALLPAVILGSVWTFNMFNIIYLVSGGQPGGATDILITEAYRWAFEQDRYGYASAYSLVIFVILIGYAALTQRLSRSAEEVYR